MRAVALLPHPSRAVLVLADVGGVPLTEVATLLLLPEARLKAELWHARLAVDTLRGAGVDGTPTPPLLEAVDAAPGGDDAADDCAGVAPLWCEPVPDEFLDRLAHDLHDRRQRRRQAPHLAGRRLPVLGGLLGIVILVAGAAVWHEKPRLADNVPAAAAAQPATPTSADSARRGDMPVRPLSPMVPDGGERVANRRGSRVRPYAG